MITMGDAKDPTFSSEADATAHWQSLYEEVKEEFAEFKETSLEYEKELETELAQKEGLLKDERRARERMERELEQIKDKLSTVSSQATENVTDLQGELATIKTDYMAMINNLRSLEQSHDMLEQGERRAQSSVSDLETKLETVIERNAFLEYENNNLEVELQHMREELRDCQNELAVMRNQPAPPSPQRIRREHTLSGRPSSSSSTDFTKSASVGSGSGTGVTDDGKDKPAGKYNIMNDMLMRIMSLEKRLVNTRSSIWPVLPSKEQSDKPTITASEQEPCTPTKPANPAALFFKQTRDIFTKGFASPQDASKSSISSNTSTLTNTPMKVHDTVAKTETDTSVITADPTSNDTEKPIPHLPMESVEQ